MLRMGMQLGQVYDVSIASPMTQTFVCCGCVKPEHVDAVRSGLTSTTTGRLVGFPGASVYAQNPPVDQSKDCYQDDSFCQSRLQRTRKYGIVSYLPRSETRGRPK